MILKDVLTNIGLNSKETAVYLAALELGDSPASEIASRAKMNRVSTYDVLEKLSKKGFISSYTKDGVKTFAATDPEIIRKDLNKKYKDLEEALPELRRIHGKTVHPLVRYYEGLEGVKKIYSDTLAAKTEILNYADSKSIREFWPNYDEEYVKERVKRRIYLRGIAPRDDYGRRVVAQNENMHREIRLVKAGAYAFANEINIYDNKVAIISFGKSGVVGMIIEGEEIANTQRAIFMMAWEFAGTQHS